MKVVKTRSLEQIGRAIWAGVQAEYVINAGE
jgi:hypothetical protein